MLRRLSPIQPESFEFLPANLEWARAQMTKYPEGRQQSAIIPVEVVAAVKKVTYK